METAPPRALADHVVVGALRDGWSLEVTSLTYEAKGAGAYHWRADTQQGPRFVTVDDLDTKPWIGTDRDAVLAGLGSAYATAGALHDDGLPLVVAPLPATDGRRTVRLDDQHAVAVLPLLSGTAGTWGAPIRAGDRATLLLALARLHEPRWTARVDLPRRRRALPERAALLDALADLTGPWTGGPRAEEARRAVAVHAVALRERLDRFDGLAAQLDRAGPAVVVTHGEPHPGNLLTTAEGLRLLDWDTVALAEPERDLWMLDTHPGALDAYVEATGRPVDPAAVELWRLAWTLSDLAWLTDAFRHGGRRSPEAHWPTFVRLLEGGVAEPYGR